jgi:acylphosphatase
MKHGAAGRPVRKRVAVTGVVQGVGYRYWAMTRAREMSLSGYVRNMPDGSVELVLQGPEPSVLKMIEFCGRGPAWATVRSVEVVETGSPDPGEEGQPFRVMS